jgi:hypothetical protein
VGGDSQRQRSLPIAGESHSCASVASKGRRSMRFLHGLPAVLSMASVLFWGMPLAPEYGSCPVCCSVYPSGWRGMCVRRCMSDRQRFPRAERRFMRCECNFDWLRAWSCRGRY